MRSPEKRAWSFHRHAEHLPKDMSFDTFMLMYGDDIAAGLQLHWNGNTLVSLSEADAMRSLRKHTSSGFVGVSKCSDRDKYMWRVMVKGKTYRGREDTESEAVNAREKFLNETGTVAYKNIP